MARDFEPWVPTIWNRLKQADINEGGLTDGTATCEREELVEQALAMAVKRWGAETVIRHPDQGRSTRPGPSASSARRLAGGP